MTKSIPAALWEWFAGCAEIARLFFNFGGDGDGDTVIAPSGDTLLDDYIDGSQRRRYAFELYRTLPLTTDPNDDGNVLMLEDVESVLQWVRDQNDDGNYPEFPDGCTIDSVSVLEDMNGYVSMVDQSTARYMIPMAITYIKE